MKWLSKRTETILCSCLLIVGAVLPFFFWQNPLLAIGVLIVGVSEIRLIELYATESNSFLYRYIQKKRKGHKKQYNKKERKL